MGYLHLGISCASTGWKIPFSVHVMLRNHTLQNDTHVHHYNHISHLARQDFDLIVDGNRFERCSN